MEKPLVAVFMVTYNHESFISEAIESVLIQKVSFSYTLFIGDDASTDRTTEICIQYRDKNPNIIQLFLNYRNIGGLANALQIYNACFSSGAKYIALLEGDDYWTDTLKLQKQVEALETSRDSFFCFTSAEMLENNTKKLIRPDYNKIYYNVEDFILNQTILGTATFMFRKTELPLWYHRLITGDKGLIYFFASLGRAIYIDSPTAVYRVHSNGMHSGLTDTAKVNNVIHDFKIIDRALGYKYHKTFRKSLALSSDHILNTLAKNIAEGCYTEARKDIIVWSKIQPVYKILRKISFKNLVKIILGTRLYMKIHSTFNRSGK